MEEIRVASFSDFEQMVHDIRSGHAGVLEEKNQFPASHFLFRGQSDSKWQLSTTLERHHPGLDLSLLGYFRCAANALPQIESFTGKSFALPSFSEFQELAWKQDGFLGGGLPANVLGYWIYLRHFGVPSPLLDWTKSPYIGAFFSFWYARQLSDSSDNMSRDVAIFMYLEYVGTSKDFSQGRPSIGNVGFNLRTDKRHYLQQSQYTMCLQQDTTNRHIFSLHDLAVGHPQSRQDRLWKFVIPKAERDKALDRLFEMGISPFSLFGTDEALLATVWRQVSGMLG